MAIKRRLYGEHPYYRVTRHRVALMVLASAAIALVIGFALPPGASSDSPIAYAIRDAQIVISPGKTIGKGTVVVRNGLIIDVGENVKIPGDARVIEAAGMTVYPGLIDGYTSLGLAAPAPAQPAGGQGRQGGGQAAAAPQQPPEAALGDPSSSAADQVKPGGTAMDDARAVGVTTALSSPRQGIFAGQSALINLSAEQATGLVVRAPVALTVQFSTGGGFGGQYPGSLMGTVSYIRQQFYDAIHYRDEVDRYNRVKRGVERPRYDKRLGALLPALKGELPVLFVANTDGDIRRALMISDEFKLKPMITGAMYAFRVADLLKSKNVPVIVSLDFPRRQTDLPDDEDEPLRLLRQRADAQKNAARLAQAGVRFAFTSGTLRPQDFIGNVQRAVENGLSRDEALRALTSNAAEIFGVSDQLGSIEVGKIANLVIVSGDLIARDAKIRHILIDGREVELKKPEPARPGGPGGRPGARPGPVADPTGEWTLSIQAPDGEHTVRLVLNRAGDQITGTLGSPMGDLAVRDARLNGNELRFAVTAPAGGESVNATVTATIDGNNIRGAIVLGEMGTFEFTGTRPR
jgi:imidazolonepropionase-like amidohydrolase